MSGARGSHLASAAWQLGVKSAGTQLTPFYSVWGPSQGMALPTVIIGFSVSVNLI